MIDARNMLHPADMKALGFEYMSFGRPDQVAVTTLRQQTLQLSTSSTELRLFSRPWLRQTAS